MRVQVRKLRDVMGLLQPVIPKNPTLRILSNVLLKDGKAMAMNMEATVIVDLPEAGEGILVPITLIEFLNYVPGHIIADIGRDEKGNVAVVCGTSKSVFPYVDPEDYPRMPDLPLFDLQVDGDKLIGAMMLAKPYMARTGERPTLKGVTLVIGPEKSHVAAGDGYRMFYKDIPCRADPRLWIIPDTTVPLLQELWKKTAVPEIPAVDALLVQVAIAKRLMRLGVIEQEESQRLVASFGKVTLVSRLIGGTPPDWMAVIPTAYKSCLTVFAPDLYRAILQVATVAGDGLGKVRLDWDSNELRISTGDNEETAQAMIFVTLDGQPGYIAFNYHYLLSYLKPRQGMVDIRFDKPDRPGVFLDGQCIAVIMPVLDTPTKEEKPQESKPVAVEEKDSIQVNETPQEQSAPAQETPPGEPEAGAAEKPARRARKKATAKAKA